MKQPPLNVRVVDFSEFEWDSIDFRIELYIFDISEIKEKGTKKKSIDGTFAILILSKNEHNFIEFKLNSVFLLFI